MLNGGLEFFLILAWLLHYKSALVMPKAIAEAPKILLVVETETPPKSRFLFLFLSFRPGGFLLRKY